MSAREIPILFSAAMELLKPWPLKFIIDQVLGHHLHGLPSFVAEDALREGALERAAQVGRAHRCVVGHQARGVFQLGRRGVRGDSSTRSRVACSWSASAACSRSSCMLLNFSAPLSR